ncbi:MAG: saccharopine dehydrogenase, partial [Saprospiraceae bacterium]|nr:saccharopine dehydrogenase [Saprospiraceae bacterium]
WNPRNVVLAGNKTARFRRDGQEKFVPYIQLFRNARVVEVPGQGKFDMYPNRDSVSYAHIYGFPDIKNILRGTLRHPGFCQAWGALIALGLTDPDTRVNGAHFTTYRDLLLAFLPAGKERVREKIIHYACLSDADIVEQILWLFDDTPIPKRKTTVADLLENLILQKWGLKENDKDLVVMQHEIDYELGEVKMRSQSSMSMMGENKNNTAMANLVGLPLGICARYLLQEKIRLTGVRRPVDSEVYVPVLQELENYGVLFTEKAISLA